jgi:hypothetical protein
MWWGGIAACTGILFWEAARRPWPFREKVYTLAMSIAALVGTVTFWTDGRVWLAR